VYFFFLYSKFFVEAQVH